MKEKKRNYLNLKCPFNKKKCIESKCMIYNVFHENCGLNRVEILLIDLLKKLK